MAECLATEAASPASPAVEGVIDMAEQRKTTYGSVYCDTCQQTHYYKSVPDEHARARHALTCPACRKDLAEQAASCGHRFLGSREGDQGEWTCDLDDKSIEDIEELLGAVARMRL